MPARTELAADLSQKAARLNGALGRLAQERRLRLQRAERGLPDLPSLLGAARQRLDERAQRLTMALPNLVRARRAALVDVERHLPPPHALLAASNGRLKLAEANLRGALRHAVAARAALAARVLPRLQPAPLESRLREAHARLDGLAARLESVSHHAVLARGYAAVFDAAGTPVTTAAAVKPGTVLSITFADGTVRATASRGDPRQATLGL